MNDKKQNSVDAHLTAARSAQRESVRHLKAAISAAQGDERIRLQAVLEEIEGAAGYLNWRPRASHKSADVQEHRP